METRRGLGMFVNPGARKLLLQGERQKFLTEEWPRIHSTIQRLGLKAEDLLNGDAAAQSASSGVAPQDAVPSQSAEPKPSKSKEEER